MIFSDFKVDETIKVNNSGIIFPAVRIWPSTNEPVLFLKEHTGIRLSPTTNDQVFSLASNFVEVRKTENNWQKPKGFKFVYENDDMKIIIRSKDV